jgi:Domain of unknown function (DUF4132)
VLPDVLARPPWPAPRKRKVLELEVPRHADRIVWAEGEQHEWAHPGGGTDRTLEAWEREEILTKLQLREIVRVDAATNLEKEDLVAAIRTCEPRFLDHYGIVRAAIAKYGLDVLDVVLAAMHRTPAAALEALLRVDSLRVLPAMAHVPDMLMTWIERHAVTASLATLPAALGPSGSQRNEAIKLLKRMRRRGMESFILEAAASFGDDAITEVHALFATEPLPSRAPQLPSFVHLGVLPMVRLSNGAPIGLEALETLLQLLVLLPLAAARDAIATVKHAADPESLALLVDKLTDAWTAVGSPNGHNWVLLAAGALGDDVAARKLAEWTVTWAKAGQHPRSRVALEALSLVGSDVALMHVDRIARTMKGKLKANAAATLETLAKERGLDQEELGDRLVPTLGLDPTGSTWLDFGPRRFRVSFDEALVPELFDADDARLPRLPRPTKDDDTERAARATATFKGFQSDAKKLAPDQVRRLERAMCTQRTWSAADFHKLFVEHPLMCHLARRLVWSVSDSGITFRLTEDRTFAGADDETFALDERGRVRIAHPIVLGSAVVNRWADLLADYRIVQPFPQLGREVFALTNEEARAVSIARFEGRHVPGSRFFTLKHRGWEFRDYSIGKPVGAIVAMLSTEPGLDFLASKPDDQTLGALSARRVSGGPATFGEMSPIEASELFRDIELLIK